LLNPYFPCNNLQLNFNAHTLSISDILLTHLLHNKSITPPSSIFLKNKETGRLPASSFDQFPPPLYRDRLNKYSKASCFTKLHSQLPIYPLMYSLPPLLFLLLLLLLPPSTPFTPPSTPRPSTSLPTTSLPSSTNDIGKTFPLSSPLSFRKFLTLQEKRVVTTIRYTGGIGLRRYFLTSAKLLKETSPDVLIEKVSGGREGRLESQRQYLIAITNNAYLLASLALSGCSPQHQPVWFRREGDLRDSS